MQHQTEPKSMTLNADSNSIGGNQRQQELQSNVTSPQNNEQIQPDLSDSLVFETASRVESPHQMKAASMPESSYDNFTFAQEMNQISLSNEEYCSSIGIDEQWLQRFNELKALKGNRNVPE
mmetsp:Transcript_16267/g.33723  ORF Transcript_16267/g.33723 Transcript_16267/m.33723 type:complete len:121 (-) Transcript_16267:583-945(-)